MLQRPHWQVPGRLVSVPFLALALACGGGGSGGDPNDPQAGSLQVYNGGNLVMSQLYVAPAASASWGVDQLAPQVLLPGDSLTLTSLAPDAYDVEAVFADGSQDEVLNVGILDGALSPLTLMNTGNGTVAVVNNSALAINAIYLTPASNSTWGPNQADLPLAAGLTLNLTGIAPGSYDLRVDFLDGSVLEFKAITVTAGLATDIQVN